MALPYQRAKPLACVGRSVCGLATVRNRGLAPAKHLSRQDIVVKRAGLVVLQDKIVCQALLEAALQMQEGKQAVKMVKREEIKCPKGNRRLRAPHQRRAQQHRNTDKREQHKSNSTTLCLRKPPLPTHLHCSSFSQAARDSRCPSSGQGTRNFSTRWGSPRAQAALSLALPANCPKQAAGMLALRLPALGPLCSW